MRLGLIMAVLLGVGCFRNYSAIWKSGASATIPRPSVPRPSVAAISWVRPQRRTERSTRRRDWAIACARERPKEPQGDNRHGRLQARDLPDPRTGRAPASSIDDKVFDAAKLTGKAAYSTVLGDHHGLDGRQGRAARRPPPRLAKSRVKGQPLGQDQAARAAAVALYDLLRGLELRRSRRRDGPQDEPAGRSPIPIPRASRPGTSSRPPARSPTPARPSRFPIFPTGSTGRSNSPP